MKLIPQALIWTLLAGAIACDSDPAAPSDPPVGSKEEQLQTVISNAVEPTRPGVILQVSGPAIEFTGTAGVTGDGTDQWSGGGHVHHAASVGKSFVGLAMARLVSDGQLSLDDGLDQWLPANVAARIPQSATITVRDLLQHTSGIVDVLNEMEDAVAAFADDPEAGWDNRDFIEFALDRPLHFAPGSAFRYSNTNFMLAGMIMEAVTGAPYATTLRESVFDPLGMDHTTTSLHENVRGPVVRGHLTIDGQLNETTDFALLWGPASGGQWTTVEDLTRFVRGLFESPMIDEDTRTILLQPSEWAPYGLGVGAAETPYGLMVGHDGLLVGYETMIGYFPDHGVSIVLAANGVGTEIALADVLADIWGIVFDA